MLAGRSRSGLSARVTGSPARRSAAWAAMVAPQTVLRHLCGCMAVDRTGPVHRDPPGTRGLDHPGATKDHPEWTAQSIDEPLVLGVLKALLLGHAPDIANPLDVVPKSGFDPDDPALWAPLPSSVALFSGAPVLFRDASDHAFGAAWLLGESQATPDTPGVGSIARTHSPRLSASSPLRCASSTACSARSWPLRRGCAAGLGCSSSRTPSAAAAPSLGGRSTPLRWRCMRGDGPRP